ncbi:MAG TPA: MOSC N-terminal beta barrel domain-containing protein [Gemmatimonadales bacterium]|nr:MOSC N-terminal beta barrel domain-containing protein [Gemmatimonadales bacterium]
MTLRLSALHIYPIKAARGIPLGESVVDDFGLRYDRRWMVVDQSGVFLSQRSHPRLALVVPCIRDGVLQIDAPGMPTLRTPLHAKDAVATSVTVWRDRCGATWLGDGPAQWFSAFLDCPCSLVHMGDGVVRPADPAFAPDGTKVSFADAFPFLVLSEESLSDLNRRLSDPLPMNRFRPNLVVAGGEPFAEDTWNVVEIGGVRVRMVKPCARCVVTTTDQSTGERGQEPLRTLATYRKMNGEVMFGQNGVHHNTGTLRVGDPVIIRA